MRITRHLTPKNRPHRELLNLSGGVNGAILATSGPEIQEELHAYLNEQGISAVPAGILQRELPGGPRQVRPRVRDVYKRPNDAGFGCDPLLAHATVDPL